MALFLPAANEVKSVLDDFAFQFRNFFRRVLQIGIHGNDNAASCRFKTELKSGAFAVVASHPNAHYPSRIRLRQLRYYLPRIVPAPVVHEDDLIRAPLQHTVNPSFQLWQAFLLVVKRYDDGQVNHSKFSLW